LAVSSALRAGSPAGAQGLIDTGLQGIGGSGVEQGVTVMSRARPMFDPLGERVGSFLFSPNLTLGLGGDSAVTPGRGSWLAQATPALSVASDWGRDRLSAHISATQTQYLDLPTQDTTDWGGDIQGALDIGPGALSLAALHQSLHQTLQQLGAVPADQPVAYRVDGALARLSLPMGRLTIEPALSVTTFRYDPASIGNQPIDEKANDRDVVQGSVAARYELSTLRSLVMVARIAGTSFTLQPAPGVASQNSTGGALLGGIDTVEGVWRYRLLLGVGVRQFANPAEPADVAPLAEISAAWSPSGLTTVTALLVQTNQDADIANVGTSRYTRARISVDHEYLRNVVLHAHIGAERATFGFPAQTETLAVAGAGVSWLVNRNVRVEATYDANVRTPPISGTERLSNIGLVQIRLAM